VTFEGTTAAPQLGSGGGAADPGPDVQHLIARRDLVVPEEDRAAVVEYWTHIRQLRADVDETLLADNEIAVTWSAAAEAPRGR
jgi:hypothetical protein